MFWMTKQSNTERKLSQMNNLLSRSFSNVRRDTQNIFQWLNFLYQRNMEQDNKIKQLQLELSYSPKKPEDIRKIIDNYYSFDNMIERIKMLNEKIDNIHVRPESVPHTGMYEIEKRLTDLEEQKKATMRDKIIKRVTRNSKEYVKNLILSYLRKYGQISSLQLKEMIVYDQGLCSKSSFYRLLEEIEVMEEIGIAKKGKQKYYLYKQIKQN